MDSIKRIIHDGTRCERMNTVERRHDRALTWNKVAKQKRDQYEYVI